MRNSDKEFDRHIRSLLENAEEQAPPHVLDGIFRRMDEDAENAGIGGLTKNRKMPAFRLWLRRTGIACAVAAAVTAVAIALWPDGRGVQTVKPEMTAALSEDGFVGGGTDAESGNDIDADEETIIVSAQTASSLIEEKPYVAELITENSEAVAGIEDVAVADAEAIVGAAGEAEDIEATSGSGESGIRRETEETEAVVTASNDESDEGQESIPFGDWDEDRHTSSRVSIVVGGDVSSNGDPSGLKRSGGFRAPAVKYADGVNISQTNSESAYSIPVSVGVGVKIAFARHWAIGTGVNYSLLQRTFSGKYTKVENGMMVKSINSDIRHQLHYIGVPLNIFYNLIDTDRIKLYTYAGATAEKGILNAYRIKDSSKWLAHKENVKGVQISAGAGFGVEFMVVEQVGLYIDPGFRYYFDCDQPVNIRTQQPFMMSFEVGLRVAL